MSIVIPSLHKPEKIAVVGANGSIGQRYAKILKNRFNKNPVLCDVKEGFSHPDEICHDFFELVLICTPSSSHLDVAKKFSQTKHFFIEKPLDTSIRKIKECGLYLQNKTFVSCNIFYSKHMRTIEKHIKNARVINFKYSTFLPLWRENYKEFYSSHKSLGGGVLNDVFTHSGFAVFHMLGKPDKVSIDKHRLADYTHDTEDYAFVRLKYPDKIVNFEMSYLSYVKERSCDMILKDGSRVKVDFMGGQTLEGMNTIEDLEETYVKQFDDLSWQMQNSTIGFGNYQKAKDFMELILK